MSRPAYGFYTDLRLSHFWAPINVLTISSPLLNQGVRRAWHDILQVLRAEEVELIMFKNEIVLIDKLHYHGVDCMDISYEYMAFLKWSIASHVLLSTIHYEYRINLWCARVSTGQHYFSECMSKVFHWELKWQWKLFLLIHKHVGLICSRTL
jgi:hypothetical protein